MSEGTPTARNWRSSHTVMTELVFPEHANALGKAFGGRVMAWSDMCGGICAMRYSGGLTVTAGVDEMHFQQAIAIGDTVIVQARVNAAFHTSLEVEVTVDGENPASGERWRCVEARMTFVAIDASGRPRAVPKLLLENEDDARREREATDRREARLLRRQAAR